MYNCLFESISRTSQNHLEVVMSKTKISFLTYTDSLVFPIHIDSSRVTWDNNFGISSPSDPISCCHQIVSFTSQIVNASLSLYFHYNQALTLAAIISHLYYPVASYVVSLPSTLALFNFVICLFIFPYWVRLIFSNVIMKTHPSEPHAQLFTDFCHSWADNRSAIN